MTSQQTDPHVHSGEGVGTVVGVAGSNPVVRSRSEGIFGGWVGSDGSQFGSQPDKSI
jgi:hypothetical protein